VSKINSVLTVEFISRISGYLRHKRFSV